jgi:hypothetical protein
MARRNTSVKVDSRSALDKFMRDLALATKSYYLAELGEAIREGKHKKAQVKRPRLSPAKRTPLSET